VLGYGRLHETAIPAAVRELAAAVLHGVPTRPSRSGLRLTPSS
jgi:hypothetical protein